MTAVVLLAILLIGLKPKDISPPNHAEWLQDRTGIRFHKYGIAYTDSISDLIQAYISPHRAFSIEIALKAKSFSEDGFHFILLVHGGKDEGQLLIGQWRSSLIVMNGDDYEHRRNIDRITVTSATESPGVQFITVTTGNEGTRVYLDGQLAAAKKNMRLEMPGGENVRLLVGNSVYGNHHWEGDIYGVSVYGKTLSEDEVATHYSGWSENLNFSFAETLSPFLLYSLDKNGENQAAHGADTSHALRVPPRIKILVPSLFFKKLNIRNIGKGLYSDRDALLNFIGFIPFGLLLGATLVKLGGRYETRCVPISIAAGFLVSLWIETVQAWMPARSSDLQDLILNTAGTLAGALCCRYLLKKSPK